jgi:hypothetical protein
LYLQHGRPGETRLGIARIARQNFCEILQCGVNLMRALAQRRAKERCVRWRSVARKSKIASGGSSWRPLQTGEKTETIHASPALPR